MRTPASFDLTGRVAVVTGGNGGIGRGIALGLADAGAAVAVFGRNEEKHEIVVSQLKAIGVPSVAVAIDLTNRADLEPALSRVENELGVIDILVNNAGNVSLSGGILNEKPEDWDNVIETQMNAVFLLSRLAARSMLSRKRGRIINIGSMYSFFGSGLGDGLSRRKWLERLCSWRRGLRTLLPEPRFQSMVATRSGSTPGPRMSKENWPLGLKATDSTPPRWPVSTTSSGLWPWMARGCSTNRIAGTTAFFRAILIHMVATPSVPAHISFCGKSRSKCTPAIHLKFQSPRNVALETFSASRYLTDISISVTLVGISCSDNFAIVYCSNHDDHVMLDGGDP